MHREVGREDPGLLQRGRGDGSLGGHGDLCETDRCRRRGPRRCQRGRGRECGGVRAIVVVALVFFVVALVLVVATQAGGRASDTRMLQESVLAVAHVRPRARRREAVGGRRGDGGGLRAHREGEAGRGATRRAEEEACVGGGDGVVPGGVVTHGAGELRGGHSLRRRVKVLHPVVVSVLHAQGGHREVRVKVKVMEAVVVLLVLLLVLVEAVRERLLRLRRMRRVRHRHPRVVVDGTRFVPVATVRRRAAPMRVTVTRVWLSGGCVRRGTSRSRGPGAIRRHRG